MSETKESINTVVIGAGPAGYVAAIRLAQLGVPVAIVEREYLGGVCLNVGCIPSKALIHAGKTYETMQHAEHFGMTVTGLKADMKKLQTWKESVVKKLTTGVGSLLKGNGVRVVLGEATFVDDHTLRIQAKTGVTQLSFQRAIVATGSRPSAVPGIAVDQEDILDSTGALGLSTIPKSLLCIGGGYIGLELGSFYSKMGTNVTVVEASPSLLASVDPDLTRVVAKKLEAKGVTIHLNTKVVSCVRKKGFVEVTLQGGAPGSKPQTEKVEKVLVTIGRTPNTENLGLDRLGIRMDQRGFVSVNRSMQSSLPHVYAIGDVAGQPLLAHKGSKEGIIAAEVIAGKPSQYDVAAMPAVIFTDPEIATVGLSEAEAKALGFEVLVGVFPFGANGRALSVGETEGFVKTIGDARTGRLLGVHCVGPEASNLIAEATLALEMGAQVEDLALTVHAHPTLPEALMESAEAALGHAIHIVARKSVDGGAKSRNTAELNS